MITNNPSPPEALCAEILAQARRESEELVRRAEQDADALLARAGAEADKARQERLSLARAESSRRRELILGTVPVEARRLRAQRVEAVLQSICEEVRQKLLARRDFDYRKTVVALAAEAISGIAGDAFVVKLSPADRKAIGDGLVDEIARRVGRASLSIALSDEPAMTEGSLVIQDAEGQQVWDNGLTARLGRLWPELRQQLAVQCSLLSDDVPAGTSNSTERKPALAPQPLISSAGEQLTARQITSPAPRTAPVITRVSGPIVTAIGMGQAQMYEVVYVGTLRLVGEVVRLIGDRATIQVYEDTTMLRPGAPVHRTGAPLSIWLGPGLVGNIYDGIQRPLPAIQARSGAWIQRGEKVDPLDTARRWNFEPAVRAGDTVMAGHALGHIPETPLVRHRLMVPPGISGIVRSIVPPGEYTLCEPLAVIESAHGRKEITMLQKWPVRVPRPIGERLRIAEPLLTGQRVIDTFFPIGKGGAAAIPGGFGTGKTITQHQLAKWSDAEIVVFIGCGERGNEMTDVLREFPELKDPRSGRPLMERTILIANTSNMPVAAREVSLYTGITLAEYYRDMGLNVAVFADSTSRWAEALRELAARLEEMPAEEGFPATLPTRLAQFYERGGAVTTLGGDRASVSIVGAVSPPGGDFSEPVTQHTRRFIRCFWALDTELANGRHYPSIHWLRSYSEYVEDVSGWWQKQAPDWSELRTEALTLLQREDHLQQIVKLVGPDVLPDADRLILFIAEILKDGFLTQSSFDEKDMYCSPERQVALLRLILTFYRKSRSLIHTGVPLASIRKLSCVSQVLRAKSVIGNSEREAWVQLEHLVHDQLEALAGAPTKGTASHG